MDITYYNTYDLPVPYRNIKIYPATVKDCMFFNAYSRCLTLDKNSIPDIKIISMNDLQYIYYSTSAEEKQPYLLWLDRMLAICLKDDESFKNIQDSIKRYRYDNDGTAYFMIGDERYTQADFLEIKNIICEQNMVEIPDENVSKEVRDSLEKAREYKNKISGGDPASFEDYIVSLSMVTGWSFDYISNMTIRKFLKSIKRYDNYVHYQIYLTMSAMTEFKDKSIIKHWLSNLDTESKYSDVSMDYEDAKKKVEGANS